MGRTTCIHLVQRKAEQHLAWFLPGAALSGAFAPVPIGTAKAPAALATAHNIRLDRSTAHWAFREMAQFMYPKWIHVRDIILGASSSMERQALEIIQDSEHTNDLFSHGSSHLVEQWQQLYSDLLLRFSDGWDYSLTGGYPNYEATSLGYPAAWLHEVGYTSGPVACYDTCR